MAMTIEEAKQDFNNINEFCHCACGWCNNDWYCPTDCVELEKARRIPFEKILKSYARNDGDFNKVIRYIRRYKEN